METILFGVYRVEGLESIELRVYDVNLLSSLGF